LWYSIGKDFTLIAYKDADWEGSIDYKKSSSGGEFFLGNYLVLWLSKKKTSISLSIEEVKYIIAATCCTQVL
jgi:hypothetical protein